MVRAKEEQEVIRTIYHENVADFFESIGLYEELKQGELRCVVCDRVITLKSFRAVTRISNVLLFCCNKESCIHNFSKHVKGA